MELIIAHLLHYNGKSNSFNGKSNIYLQVAC